MEAQLLALGLPGVVILGLAWACKKLYSDLQDAREDLDEARQQSLAALERSFVLALKRSSRESLTSSEDN